MQRRPYGRRRPVAAVAAVLASSALLAGCAAVEDLVASRRAEEPLVAVIGVVAPLQGSQAAAGAGVRDAVQLAVADAGGAVGEWGLEVVVVDDGGVPEQASVAAATLVDDRRLVAAVGGLSSPVLRVLQPLLDARGVVLVSPTDTDLAHTRGADPASPLRPYAGYFTVAAPGGSEPAAAAAHLASVAGAAATVATITSGTAESTARGSEFARAAAALGLTVVPVSLVPPPQAATDGPAAEGPATEVPASEVPASEVPAIEGPAPQAPPAEPSVPPEGNASPETGEPSPGPVAEPPPADPVATAVEAARSAGAVALYTGAEPAPSAELVRAVADAGWQVPVIGGSALLGEQFVAAAGPGAEGVVATSAPSVAATTGQDGSLAERFAAAGFDSDPGPFGAAAYDAATAVVQALARCLPPAESVRAAREGCVAEMSQVSFTGLTGPVAFTEWGERADTGLTLWRVTGGAWVPAG